VCTSCPLSVHAPCFSEAHSKSKSHIQLLFLSVLSKMEGMHRCSSTPTSASESSSSDSSLSSKTPRNCNKPERIKGPYGAPKKTRFLKRLIGPEQK
jgi:hypothetical protein